jgi:hypothetical protein
MTAYYETKFLPLALGSEVEPGIVINTRTIQRISTPAPIISDGRVIRRDRRYLVVYREGRELRSGMATLADLERLGIDVPRRHPANRPDPDPWTGTDADVEQRLADMAKLVGYAGRYECTSPSLEAAVAELTKKPGTLAHRYYDPRYGDFDFAAPEPEAKETRRRRRG